MSNGAAGCGYEYTNPDHRCPHLARGDEFYCLKYREVLNTAKVTGHPFRCTACTEDADKHVESLLAKKRNDTTRFLRRQLNDKPI